MRSTVGPIFLQYDQRALDEAYDQRVWASNMEEILAGYGAASARTREKLGAPLRYSYGPTQVEGLDVFRAVASNAPIQIFLHGGAWRRGTASEYGFPAEVFVAAGIHYVALDFAGVPVVGGDLRVLASQVRRAIVWIRANAARFGGDPRRLYIAGHSSGAHLAAVALTTNWQEFDVEPDILKGGLLASGMYDLHPVRLSARSSYVAFDDEMEESLSPARHINRLAAPLVIAWGTRESPEFIRQARDFISILQAAGKPVEEVVVERCNHFEIMRTFGTSGQALGRAALALITSMPPQASG
jgi:arylformamidase